MTPLTQTHPQGETSELGFQSRVSLKMSSEQYECKARLSGQAGHGAGVYDKNQRELNVIPGRLTPKQALHEVRQHAVVSIDKSNVHFSSHSRF